MRKRWLYLASVAAVGLGITLSAGPAWSEPAANEAGYTASSVSIFSTFSGTLSIPTFTCPPSGEMFIEPQVSVSGNYGRVTFSYDVSCVNGAGPFLANAVVEIASDSPRFPDVQSLVTADMGDDLGLSVSTNSTGKTVAKIVDKSTGAIGTGVLALAGGFNQVVALGVWQCSGGCTGVAPIAAFSPGIHFGDLRFGGSLVQSMKPTRFRMIDDSGAVMVSTTPINAAGSFWLKFKRSS